MSTQNCVCENHDCNKFCLVHFKIYTRVKKLIYIQLNIYVYVKQINWISLCVRMRKSLIFSIGFVACRYWWWRWWWCTMSLFSIPRRVPFFIPSRTCRNWFLLIKNGLVIQMNGRTQATVHDYRTGVGDKRPRCHRQTGAPNRMHTPYDALEQKGKKVGNERGHRPPAGSHS